MKRKEITEKLTSIKWWNNEKVCIYTRRIPSFIYPFAPGGKEGFADTLKTFITEEAAWENLNGLFLREVPELEANEWREWAKKQKEGVENDYQ